MLALYSFHYAVAVVEKLQRPRDGNRVLQHTRRVVFACPRRHIDGR